MSLTVLTDTNINQLLTTLTSTSLTTLLTSLSNALVSYSTTQESQHQCHRQGITRHPSGPTILFMPASLPGNVSIKIVGVPPPQTPQPPIRGVMLICDEDGRAMGVVNAAEITAFRTALGSMLVYQYREKTENIVVFGAGKQALWHVRLALILRGDGVRSVTVVNRSRERAERLVENLREFGSTTAKNVAFSVLLSSESLEEEGYQTRLRTLVEHADVIFCTTPSTEPLFRAAWITSFPNKTRFISAIGSYKPNMQEIDSELLRGIAAGTVAGSYHPTNNSKESAGCVIVDSRKACAVEAGELIKAEIQGEDMLEVGELAHTIQDASTKQTEKDRLSEWLKTGLVVYKSVGMGIMDLEIGKALIRLADVQSLGTRIDDF